MFGSVWRFVKRHKKKFIFTGLVIGGVYYCGQYAKRKLMEYQEKEALEYLTTFKKQQHFMSCQNTCNSTIISMMGNLRESLCSRLNTEELLVKIKSNQSNKMELWEDLKIMSFTRMIAAIYGTCVLVLCMKVQMSIVAGVMFRNVLKDKESRENILLERDDKMKLPASVQRQFLETTIKLFDRGINDIIASVNKAVLGSVSELGLKEKLTSTMLRELVTCIRKNVEVRKQNGYHDYVPFSLVQFMDFMMDEEESEEESQACSMSEMDILASQLKQQTMEILQGSDFHSTSNICLDTAFLHLFSGFEDYFSPAPGTSNEADVSNGVEKPLAKVIPIVNGLVFSLASDAPNRLLTDLLNNDGLQNFASEAYQQASAVNDNASHSFWSHS